MANVLVTAGTYDKDYVENYSVGFEDWAARLEEYTPEWAAEITGIDAATIERVAEKMWECAPRAAIEQGWRASTGCSYQNSGETARAICLFNTLLGCWGVEGGAAFPSSASAGKLTDARFAAPAAPKDKILGQAEYPLSAGSMGVSTYALSQIPEGKVKGVFFYQSNCVGGYSNPAKLAEFVKAAELSVCIDVQMTETCLACQYVLPDTTYLERLEVPEFVGGRIPYVGLRDQVLEKIHPETRPVDQIFTELAEACGVGDYFKFTVDELADAQLQTIGLSLDGLREMGGFTTFPDKPQKFGLKTSWNTASKKVQFTSEACEKAGLPASPGWLEPLVMPGEGEFRLIGGKQSIHTHTQTANVDTLMAISKQYGLERAWLNADAAAKLGIADNDEIEITSSEFTGKVRVKVTQLIEPTSLYVPSHYGRNVAEQRIANGVGVAQMDFVPFHVEPGYGGTMSQEVIVTVKKGRCIMTRYGMLIDTTNCIGCFACRTACQRQNGLDAEVDYIRYEEVETGIFPTVGHENVPLQCMHCEDAPCVAVCPTGASYIDETGVVAVDEGKCIGCRYCMAACPYQVRVHNKVSGAVEKCKFCHHWVYEHPETPSNTCVSACPTHCRIFGDLDDPQSELSHAVVEKNALPISGDLTKAKIFYVR